MERFASLIPDGLHRALLFLLVLVPLVPLSNCATGRSPSDVSYPVVYVSSPDIQIDGRLDETAWDDGNRLTEIHFQWRDRSSPKTVFRSFYGEHGLYFSFRTTDRDLVLRDTIETEKDIAHEDRVELFFARDPLLNTYFGLEIDAGGRVYSYQAEYDRNFKPEWDLTGITVNSTVRKEGYTVEGMIPLSFFLKNGLLTGTPPYRVMTGVFRAEFIEQNNNIKHRWMSWIDPGVENPDFHTPEAFGWFEFQSFEGRER